MQKSGEFIKKTKLIGLTGTYCAGKNYVAKLLEERGLPVLDVDKLGHKAIELERDAIVARFGQDIIEPVAVNAVNPVSPGGPGLIDRRLLGAKVFGKPAELAALEAIVHPAANRLTEAWIQAQGNGSCVINAAVLHKSSAFERLDAIILVQAPFLTRLLRARKRDGLSWKVLLKRFNAQNEFAAQYFHRKTDIYTIDNKGYTHFISRLLRQRLEKRIERILAFLEI